MRAKAIELVELLNVKPEARQALSPFRVGDTVKVHTKISEGDKERIQIFEGVVIRRKRAHTMTMFTVRKVSYGVGVERTFPLHTPTVAKLEVVRRGDVRRAKQYYLRERSGKSAKIKEKRDR